MPINDLDLLVPESSFPEIIKKLEQNNISYKQMQWPSIVASTNNFKIDLDSIECYLGSRSREVSVVQINNLEFNILNVKSLIDVYQEAVDHMSKTKGFEKYRELYAIKIKNLKKVA
jgi:hypothetical protein